MPADIQPHTLSHVCRMFMQAHRPMLVTGQPMNSNLDEAVCMVQNDERYVPDFILYIGGSIVSKRVKHFLRKAKETWVVNETGEVTDTFQNLTRIVVGDGAVVADQVRFMLEQQPHPFVRLWDELLAKVRRHAADYVPDYSQTAAVKYFEQQLSSLPSFGKGGQGFCHYANSSAIRLANIFARHHVWCNRGVNGIEGSLSTAAGCSLTTDEQVFCVIGDLSFFYDQNALWNSELRGNLRILLMNNGCGGIFSMLKGLEQSAARDRLVAASHHATAEGICRQNDIIYLSVHNMGDLHNGIDALLWQESSRPVLLEVFTDAAVDGRVLRDYYRSLSAVR